MQILVEHVVLALTCTFLLKTSDNKTNAFLKRLPQYCVFRPTGIYFGESQLLNRNIIPQPKYIEAFLDNYIKKNY